MRSLKVILERRGPFDLHDARFDRLELFFGAEVELLFADGRTRTARCAIPPGAAGRDTDERVALSRRKLAAEAPAHAETIEAALDDDATPIRALMAGLTRHVAPVRARSST